MSKENEQRGSTSDQSKQVSGTRNGGGRSNGNRNSDRGYQLISNSSRNKVSDEIPILRYGPDNNFPKFKERIARSAMDRFGNIATLIETKKKYEPPEIDKTNLT